MARFTQYPTASTGDYEDATTFLIANSDGEIKQASLEGFRSNFGCDIQCAELLIPTADVLQLNSTPQTIVAAQGVGTVIEIISASFQIAFNTTAYATNTTLELKHSGAAISITTCNVLNSSISNIINFNAQSSPIFNSTQMLENADLQVSVNGGDPTAGDSDITIRVLYRVITL